MIEGLKTSHVAVALVKVSEGATTGFYGVFAFVDCGVVHATYEPQGDDGWTIPTSFSAGASTQYASGFSCTPTGIVQTYSERTGGEDLESSLWEITDHEHVYDPDTGRFDLIAPTKTLLTWANDRAAIEAVYRVDCP